MRIATAVAALVFCFSFMKSSTMIGAAASPVAPVAMPDAIQLSDGSSATISRLGIVRIVSKDGSVTIRRVPISGGLPDRATLVAKLNHLPETKPYVSGRVIVVYRDGVASPDKIVLSRRSALALRRAKSNVARVALAPAYTNDSSTNRLLASFGVDHSERLFSHARASHTPGRLNFMNAYRLHVTASRVHQAVAALLKSPSVVYASPDWYVSPMHTDPMRIPQSLTDASRRVATSNLNRPFSGVPTNFMLQSSGQSLLNAPSTNATAAFDEIQNKFHQMPGQGEIITNVSIGDIAYSGNCRGEKNTHFINGQMYIDWPSMPLIAAYSANSSGDLSGSTEVCGGDANLGEVGLDFSMMAPLPHDRQRPGENGNGLTDLLGIGPGATYRLVVPDSPSGAITDLAAAFFAAAQQTPRPNIITASLGFGFDTFGFPGRFLEDDPLMQSVIASLVNNYNIVVCVSANDGLREFTGTSVGPSGGSAPTNVVRPGGSPTNLNDIAFSTVPSLDFDSGSIDVGGTTLDDIFAAPPQNAEFAALSSQHAFPETRFDGSKNFSSGYGSRVNVSAPSDNVISFVSAGYGNYDSVFPVLSGGTSASAPEAAAAAAVALQVARLTGHPLQNAAAVRTALESTGDPVPKVPQSDVNNHVGPQINLGRLVETLLSRAGQTIQPAVSRVAVEQRRTFNLDSSFVTFTDPSNIDLQGPVSSQDGTNTDRHQKAWITLAPDWEGLPRNAEFRLNVVGRYSSPLATTRWARLLPEQILRAAGLPLVSTGPRTVKLRYRAFTGMRLLAQSIFSLTFGPADATTTAVLAPDVSAVVAGSSIAVRYNLERSRGFTQPKLIVSRAGRFDPISSAFGSYFNVDYAVPLSARSGTVQVPVNALEGGGIYGIGIVNGTAQPDPYAPFPTYSDFAIVRVAPAPSNRPAAPLVGTQGALTSHFIDVPVGSPFQVSWDVRNIPRATGALLEFSAPGPNNSGSFEPFNNLNGTQRDRNGRDSGSVYAIRVGVSGTLSLTTQNADLLPTFNHVVRVIPMSGSAAVGEASDVSTVQVDGVVPSDGGNVNSGYAIDPQGDDGYLTSSTGFGSSCSLEIFSQQHNAITSSIPDQVTTSAGVCGNATPAFGGAPIYAQKRGLYMPLFEIGVPNLQYNVVDVTTGALSPWTPPNPVQNQNPPILQADNDQTHDGVFLAGTNGDVASGALSSTLLFTSHVAANTFGPAYDVLPALPPCHTPRCYDYGGLAVNTKTNAAILAAGMFGVNFPRLFGPPGTLTQIVKVNLATGAHSSFYLPTGSDTAAPHPQGVAVDSQTNKAFTVLDDGRAAFIDLATRSAKIVSLPGAAGKPPNVLGRQQFLDRNFFAGSCSVVDQKNHLFLTVQPFSSDFFTNNNALNDLLVYNESGNLVSRREILNILAALFWPSAKCLVLKPQTRSGYIFSKYGSQLEPFSY